MFGSALRRAAPAASVVPTGPYLTASLASLAAMPTPLAGSGLHQRRYSSSCPPDSSRGSSAPQPPPSDASPRSNGKKLEKKTYRGRKKAAPAMRINLPQVPMTKHLQETDVNLSSFFSLHRPISVTASIPSASSQISFDSIFKNRVLHNNKFSDVVHSLSNTVENLEAAYEGLDERDIQDGSQFSNATHLDGSSTLSLKHAVSQYRPFNPPPPAVPFEESTAKRKSAAGKQRARSTTAGKAGQAKRSWKTTIVVTETTDANGSQLFTAATSPMIEIPVAEQEAMEDAAVRDLPSPRETFRDRMRVRHRGWMRRNQQQKRGNMLLISVKRQRKLKMKKHKYKKLLKRTRNERRKLDRA